jgi:hypothetical protein
MEVMMSGKAVTVELFGAARVIAGRSEVSITLEDGAAWQDAVVALADAAPELVGEVISADRRSLLSDYTFNLGGRVFMRDLARPVQLSEIARVTLMDFSDI